MAIYVENDDPASWIKKIVGDIKANKLDTWACDAQGDLSHTPPQYKGKAWLRPAAEQSRIAFYVLGNKTDGLPRSMFGLIQGRFVEVLVGHFFKKSKIIVTSMADGQDNAVTEPQP